MVSAHLSRRSLRLCNLALLSGRPSTWGGDWGLGVYMLCTCLQEWGVGSALKSGRTKPEKTESLRLHSEKLGATQTR